MCNTKSNFVIKFLKFNFYLFTFLYFQIGKYVTVNGINCLNLSSHDFLGFNEETIIKNSAIESVRKYGIGSCGPRGFFGTVGNVLFHIKPFKNKLFSFKLVHAFWNSDQ